VDRIASAWLINRCIDVAPSFQFVQDKHCHGLPGELRFDRFDAEYSQQGDNRTLETLHRSFSHKDTRSPR
jgi:hypothetical protein